MPPEGVNVSSCLLYLIIFPSSASRDTPAHCTAKRAAQHSHTIHIFHTIFFNSCTLFLALFIALCPRRWGEQQVARMWKHNLFSLLKLGKMQKKRGNVRKTLHILQLNKYKVKLWALARARFDRKNSRHILPAGPERVEKKKFSFCLQLHKLARRLYFLLRLILCGV